MITRIMTKMNADRRGDERVRARNGETSDIASINTVLLDVIVVVGVRLTTAIKNDPLAVGKIWITLPAHFLTTARWCRKTICSPPCSGQTHEVQVPSHGGDLSTLVFG